MTYHLKHGISLRDYIVADPATATALVTEALDIAGLRRVPYLTTTALEDTIKPCGKPMSSEGVEKCIVLISEDMIAEVKRDVSKTPVILDKFMISLDQAVEEADEQFYHKHVI